MEWGSRGSLPTVLPRSGWPRGGIATVADFLWAVASEGARPGSPQGSGLHQPGVKKTPRARRGVSSARVGCTGAAAARAAC
jgi:hypothetical protein